VQSDSSIGVANTSGAFEALSRRSLSTDRISYQVEVTLFCPTPLDDLTVATGAGSVCMASSSRRLVQSDSSIGVASTSGALEALSRRSLSTDRISYQVEVTLFCPTPLDDLTAATGAGSVCMASSSRRLVRTACGTTWWSTLPSKGIVQELKNVRRKQTAVSTQMHQIQQLQRFGRKSYQVEVILFCPTNLDDRSFLEGEAGVWTVLTLRWLVRESLDGLVCQTVWEPRDTLAVVQIGIVSLPVFVVDVLQDRVRGLIGR